MLKTTARITIFQSQSNNEAQASQQETGRPFVPMVLQFYSYHTAEINTSWQNIVQTSKITFPRRIVAVGKMDYSFADYDSLSPNIFTGKIQENICGTSSMTSQLQVRKFIGLTAGNSNVSLIFNPNINNGSRYAKNDPNSGLGNYLDGQRINGLITHGDMIVVQLGYVIENRNGESLDTINSGNVGSIKGQNIISQQLPSKYSKLPLQDGYFNVDNRWRPYNRGFQFKGYVDKIKINNDGNVELDCEDFMYLFNRAMIPNATYDPAKKDSDGVNWTINSIVDDLVSSVGTYHGYSGTQSNINSMPRAVIQGTDEEGKPVYELSITKNTNIDTTIGLVNIQQASIGDVFKFFKSNYNIPCFFIPNTEILVTTPFVYNSNITKPSNKTIVGYSDELDGNTNQIGQEEFTFIMGQWSLESEATLIKNGFLRTAPSGTYKNTQNIIKTNLEFKYTDDQPVGALVKSVYLLDTKDTDGNNVTTTVAKRTKKTPTEHTIHVGDYGGVTYTYFYLVTRTNGTNSTLTPDANYDANVYTDGKLDIGKLDIAMNAYGNMMLSHINYTGFYGSFTTYGYPYVQICDIITIIDFSFPERSSRYYTKSVVYKGDTTEGLVQTIEVDYRLPNKNINM